MARQKDMKLTGTMENLIFYESNGEFLIRTMPVQTAATQKAAKDFGRASSKAKLLRMLLLPLLPAPKDKDMQNRLTTAMAKFLAWRKAGHTLQQEPDPLTGFRFERDSGLDECLKFQWLLSRLPDGNLAFEIPAMIPTDSIVAPAGTSRVQLRLLAVALNPVKEKSLAGTPQLIDISYSDAQQAASSTVLEMNAAAEMITVVALELSYWKGNRRIVREGFRPVEIVGVW